MIKNRLYQHTLAFMNRIVVQSAEIMNLFLHKKLTFGIFCLRSNIEKMLA